MVPSPINRIVPNPSIPDEIHDLLRRSNWDRVYRATAEFLDRRLATSENGNKPLLLLTAAFRLSLIVNRLRRELFPVRVGAVHGDRT